jgi:glycosyltransferase involved in cell wall biosynthesis
VQRSDSDASAVASISACVIARDEADCIAGCLASVDFCNEIVLVDSGSTDATIEIARAAGARVIEQPWLGFAAQRNLALDHAHGDWVIEVDADERVTPELRAEIREFLADPPAEVKLAALPCREILVGRALGPSAKYPRYFHRLYLRTAYRHDEARTVHEGLIPEGPVHPFTASFEHLLARTWREAVRDTWHYARLEAGQMPLAITPWNVASGALLRPSAKFVYRLSVDGGWRDGAFGLARIALDCATDSIVWIRCLLGRRGDVLGRSGVTGSVHYGNRDFRRGCLRVVGVAAGERAAGRAVDWLDAASAAGADVALIADALPAPSPGGVRVRPLASPGPLTLIRALDAESQLRPIDAVVAFGTRARLLMRVVPHGLRGSRSNITQASDPQTVDWRTRDHDPRSGEQHRGPSTDPHSEVSGL